MSSRPEGSIPSPLVPLLWAHACLVLANGPRKGSETLDVVLLALIPALGALGCLLWAARGAELRLSAPVSVYLGRVLVLSGMLFALFGNLVYGADPWELFPWRLLALPFLALYLLPVQPEPHSALRFLYGRSRQVAFGVLLVLAVGLRFAVPFLSPEPLIDVWYFTNEGASGLLEGINPYDRAFTVVDPRSETLYAYLPGQLVFDLPAVLLTGDMRWGQVGLELLTGVLIYAVALGGRVGQGTPSHRRAAEALLLLWLYWPQSLFSQEQAWVEFKQVFVAALLAWLFLKQRTGLGWASVGLLFALKQTTWPAALFLGRLPGFSLRSIGILLGVMGGLILPFVAWNPQAFYQDIVGYHVGLPLPHSPSVSWGLSLWGGVTVPLWVLAVTGGAVWVWLERMVPVALRLPRVLGAWRNGVSEMHETGPRLERLERFFVAAAALSLLPVVWRQAYINYYAYVDGLVLTALAISVARWGDAGGHDARL